MGLCFLCSTSPLVFHDVWSLLCYELCRTSWFCYRPLTTSRRPLCSCIPPPPPPTPWSLGLNTIPAPPSPNPLKKLAVCLWELRQKAASSYRNTHPSPFLFLFLQNQFEKDRRPVPPRPHTPVMLSWWVLSLSFASLSPSDISSLILCIFHLNICFFRQFNVILILFPYLLNFAGKCKTPLHSCGYLYDEVLAVILYLSLFSSISVLTPPTQPPPPHLCSLSSKKQGSLFIFFGGESPLFWVKWFEKQQLEDGSGGGGEEDKQGER